MNRAINKTVLGKTILALILLAMIAPSHLIANDRVVTVDEPWWVISGSNYYYALTHGDFANTLYDYHPAVTTTWVVTAGMLSYFPEYRGGGQGYFDVRKPKFEEFLRENGKEALDLVRNSRLIQSALILSFALLAFFLIQSLTNQITAFLSVALAMTAPFYLGHSRLLNHEGMLAVFVLVSFLGMQVYLNKNRKSIYLLLSGAAFGLAQLTKSSSIVVAALVGFMLFIELFKKDELKLHAKLLKSFKTFLLWLGAAVLVYVLLWPGMWVAPGKMLGDIYGNAFSYAFQGARLDVTEELQPSSFSLASGFGGILQYMRGWAASSTPITWLGLVLAFIALVSKDKEKLLQPLKSTLAYLIILAALFILMFGVAQGRNSPHYILTSHLCLNFAAGAGWGYIWLKAQAKWKGMKRISASILYSVALIGMQIGVGLPYAPYYFTYKNPFAQTASTIGYGEGMAQAADYLSQKPGSTDMRVYAYNGMGTFSFFFSGETLVFKRVYLIENDFTTIADDMLSSDYLVLYPIVKKAQPETKKILGVLQDVPPEKTIFINGLEYIQIYRMMDIPEAVYEKLGQ